MLSRSCVPFRCEVPRQRFFPCPSMYLQVVLLLGVSALWGFTRVRKADSNAELAIRVVGLRVLAPKLRIEKEIFLT